MTGDHARDEGPSRERRSVVAPWRSAIAPAMARHGDDPTAIAFRSRLPWSHPRREHRRVFWPGVSRVLPHQLLADGRVVPLPEPGEVLRDLHRTSVWREELQDQRHLAAPD